MNGLAQRTANTLSSTTNVFPSPEWGREREGVYDGARHLHR